MIQQNLTDSITNQSEKGFKSLTMTGFYTLQIKIQR